MSKACLVIEGGGNRGVYASGVLDAFLDYQIDIRNIYAVSAGSLNVMSYLSRQKGRSYKINSEYVLDKCISYKSALRGKSILNLDYLFNEVNDKEEFDLATFNKNKENFVVSMTDIKTGEPIYKKIEDYSKDWIYLKASASLPLYTKIVKVDGLYLLDGGISDPIPIKKVLEDGYDKIVVILTRDKEFVSKPYRRMWLYKVRYHKYPNLLKAMQKRALEYNKLRKEIEELEKEKKIFVIYPSEEIKIQNLQKDKEKLLNIYKLGYDNAKEKVEAIKEYLMEE